MGEGLAVGYELLRANRRFVAKVFRYDLPLIGAGLLYVFSPEHVSGMTVSRGVFAALVLFLLAMMQAEILRRAAPGLRTILVLPLRRETMLGIFYLGFALPGSLALALAGILVAFLARAEIDVSAAMARTMQAVGGFLFLKSMVVNILVVIRYQAFLIVGYLVLLTGILLALLILRDFLAGMIPISNGAIAALFLLGSFGCAFTVVRDIEL